MQVQQVAENFVAPVAVSPIGGITGKTEVSQAKTTAEKTAQIFASTTGNLAAISDAEGGGRGAGQLLGLGLLFVLCKDEPALAALVGLAIALTIAGIALGCVYGDPAYIVYDPYYYDPYYIDVIYIF
jgi:hypothetical protein